MDSISMRIISILFTFSCFLSTITGQTNSLKSLVEKSKKAIVSIKTYDDQDNELGIGSGFFIDKSGIILSSYHVFKGASKVVISTHTNKKYVVTEVIGENKKSDIIKVRISNELNKEFSHLNFRNNEISSGDQIFLIGNPLGFEYSVSDGIVSAIRNNDTYGKVIQFNAPISSGNSGSPLIDMNGEVVGIVTYYYSVGQNLNFAVSIEELNMLEPVNKLKFPEDLAASLNCNKTDFQIADWGSSVVKVQGRIDKKAEIDEFSMTFWNDMYSMDNNYSDALCYDNVQIGDKMVDLTLIFKHSYLSEIKFHSQTTRRTGSKLPYSGERQLKPVVFRTSFKEFFELKNCLDVLYGSGENWSHTWPECDECYLGDIEFLSSNTKEIEDLTLNHQYAYYIRWTDYSKNTELILNWSSDVRGSWILYINQIKK